jgi:phage terminase large subunit-like protein
VNAGFDLSRLKPENRAELIELLDEREKRQTRRLVDTMFPDEGPLRRELYPKHLEFFKAGATKHERAFIAANRVGKTVGFGTEIVYHLTGRYPHWWEGRRWDRPVKVLASGDTHDTTRDIIQIKMLGALSDRPDNIGTGLIPWQYIAGWVPRPHVKGAIELCRVKHVSGGESEFYMRSFEQGRVIFQGVELDIFWPDEECPEAVYTEGLMRTMTTHGITGLTFTPLQGRTPLVNNLMDPLAEAASDRAVVQCGWDDVPHLDEDTKKRMYAKLPPHQRDARSRGIPSLGSGAIYPIAEDQIVCEPFELPKHWPRAFGCDIGWNRTAAVWGAFDRDTDTGYLYAEHYRAQAEPTVHVAAIKAKGAWIPGTIDPAARGRTIKDGEQMIQVYTDLGLPMVPADNAVEAGIYAVWERLSTGRLKVFKTLGNWLGEYRGYHRDENGKIVKLNDHLMDATRYLEMTGRNLAKVEAPTYEEAEAPDWRL